MKIEICEQMVQSWLLNCKNCQIAQTNWSISPLKDLNSYESDISLFIDYFINALKSGVSSGAVAPEAVEVSKEEFDELYLDALKNDLDENSLTFSKFLISFAKKAEQSKRKKGDIDFSEISILGKSGKAKAMQFVTQTEIDILGVELEDGKVKDIYMVDTAYHKDGLNYGDTVSVVTKKIIRAVLVSDIIFGTDVSVHIIFASPECKPGPEQKIETIKKFLEPYIENRPTLKGKASKVKVELYLNRTFSEEIYVPLITEIDKLYGNNDLFMRSMNLAKISESKLVTGVKKSLPVKKHHKVKPTSTGKKGKYTIDDKYKEAAYYLRNNVGLTNVEKTILGCNNNGSTALNHLNSLGINTSTHSQHKGLLSKSGVNIDDEIKKATDDIFKNTLEEIKKRGL